MTVMHYIIVFFATTTLLYSQEDPFYQDMCLDQTTNEQSTMTYDHLYPYYIKYCAVTKIHPKKGMGASGTKAGHAVFYLKGVCKDNSHPPSGLKICDKKENYNDPKLGVGLSIDKGLKNTNFFVIPNLNMFLYGGMTDNDILDLEKKQSIVQTLINKNIFHNIHFHDVMFPKTLLEKDKEAFIANYTLGTDYGLALARNLYCINIPITRDLMKMVVQKLNQLNDSYKQSIGKPYRGCFQEGKKKDPYYHWHGIFDNCTHTIITIFYELGLLPQKKTNLPLFKQLRHIAIPSNTMLDLHQKLNVKPIHFKKHFHQTKKNKIFTKYHWIGQQHGVLSEKITVHKKNDIYQQDNHLFVWKGIPRTNPKKIDTIINKHSFSLKDNKSVGFKHNLCFYYKKYQDSIDGLSQKMTKKKNQQYARFAETFKKFLLTKKEETKKLLLFTNTAIN